MEGVVVDSYKLWNAQWSRYETFIGCKIDWRVKKFCTISRKRMARVRGDSTRHFREGFFVLL